MSRTLPTHVHAEVVVDATPAQVWAVISDPTRTGEWSDECHTITFEGGATGATPGARFHGENRLGRFGWTRSCEILTVDAEREIAWRTIPARLYRDSSVWRLRIEPAGAGTRIVQTYDLTIGPIWTRLCWLFAPAHRDRKPGLERELRRLGEVAARESVVAVR